MKLVRAWDRCLKVYGRCVNVLCLTLYSIRSERVALLDEQDNRTYHTYAKVLNQQVGPLHLFKAAFKLRHGRTGANE